MLDLAPFKPVKCERMYRTIKWILNGMKFLRKQPMSLMKQRQNGHACIGVGTTVVRTLESCANNGKVIPGKGATDLFITPGYQYQIIDRLITNFHLPGSTLLMLVSALYDREHILSSYQEAIRNQYRFYSFGDAMFIL